MRSPGGSRIAAAASSSPPTRAGAAASMCRSRPMSTRPPPCYPGIETVLVIRATGGDVPMQAGRDIWYHDEAAKVRHRLPARADGSGRPALHPLHLGFDRQAQGCAAHHRRLSGLGGLTYDLVFDYRAPDIFWCAADIGWVTGHSYILYGPLANGATTLMYEGVPNWPTPAASGRWSTGIRSRRSIPRPPRCAR